MKRNICSITFSVGKITSRLDVLAGGVQAVVAISTHTKAVQAVTVASSYYDMILR